MVDLILHFKWDRVSTINLNNLYDQPDIKQFHKLAEDRYLYMKLLWMSSIKLSDYQELVQAIANIVILLSSGQYAESVLIALQTTSKH